MGYLDIPSLGGGGGGSATSAYTKYGLGALASVTSGTGLTAYGKSALALNTSASGNSAFGESCCAAAVTATGLTGGGFECLKLATGNNNTGWGYQCLYSLVNGVQDTAIGYYAFRLLTGRNGTAVGYQAGAAATSAAGLTLVGSACGLAITTGGYSTVAGLQALGTNQTAVGHTAVGYKAGYNSKNGSTGKCVYLGYEAGPSSDTAEDNLGYIHNAAGTPTLKLDFANKRLGIAVDTPASTLDVGAGAITGQEMSAPDAPAANSYTIYAIDNSTSTELWVKFANGNSTKLADDTA